ncbi:MAG: hypothetical protein IPF64_11120 [Flavobacteriales bacterium]|nr:hypothetical protein [Flavobacteriales bacterium]
MSTESLKLQLIERLLRTTDEGLLKKVADLFRSEKSEDENGLTDEHYSIVKERYEEYKRARGRATRGRRCVRWYEVARGGAA